MDFKAAIKTCFGKYATFQGRASRSEYWYFTLFSVLSQIIAGIIDAALPTDVPVLQAVVCVVLLIPGLAVGVRRLHDRDKSGWWLLLYLLPVLGAIVLLVWFCLRGTEGTNRFGEDPLAGSAPPEAVPA